MCSRVPQKTDINKIYAVQFRYRLRSVVGKFVRSLGTRMINPLDSIGNYNATSNNMKLVHWPMTDGWAVIFGTAKRGLGGAAARRGSSSVYQM